MSKQKFQVGVVYRLDLTGQIKFGPVPEQLLWHKFTDGRIFGLLGEALLGEALVVALYNNLSRAPSEGASFDFIDQDGKQYEVRTVTKNGAKLLPSAQIGTGRKFNEASYIAKRKAIHTYIFIDNQKSPVFRIAGILEQDVPPYPPTREIKRAQFEELIANCRVVELK